MVPAAPIPETAPPPKPAADETAEPEFKAYDVEVAIKGSLVFEVSTDKEYIK